jgi:signal transduction histidine kinase
VKLELHIPDAELEIKCDGQRLKQILINLLKNASKFTFEGFLKLTVRKTMLVNSKNKNILGKQEALEFEISDSGIGISKDNQEKLFKQFGKIVQTSQHIDREGIGLGLYITKNLVEALAGKITLKSEEGVGTSVKVILPVSHRLVVEHDDIELLTEIDLRNLNDYEVDLLESAKEDSAEFDEIDESVFVNDTTMKPVKQRSF